MTETATAEKTDAEKIKVNEAKWSKTLMDAGRTAMPSIIIERQEALGLDALDMNIIVHLSSSGGRPTTSLTRRSRRSRRPSASPSGPCRSASRLELQPVRWTRS
jgi:hypothetical protein